MKFLIADIVEKLNNGDYRNESEISRGIVLKILNALGWDTFDTNIVMSEYSIGNGRVDYALTRKKGATPSVFIEVKQPGKTDHADEQLFNYAFREGIPFAILTDGKTWNFYLPSGQGKYEDRRIYKLDLSERTPEESIEKLERYLNFGRVKDGSAFDDAQRDYRSKYKAAEAKSAIPDAWKELVDSEDEMLFEMIAEAVEKKCGYKPKYADISEFLSEIRFLPGGLSHSSDCAYNPPRNYIKKGNSTPVAVNGSWYHINGKTVQVRSAKDVVIGLLNSLYETDNKLFEKCQKHAGNFGRNRQYIASSKAELYKDRPDLSELSAELKGNYFLLTNFSNQIKEKILAMAFDIAGVKKGIDVDYQL